jgi:sulfatase maturation enzyme AslB (radical SAM superfamily)
MNKENVLCPLPWHHVAIRPDGRLYPCCYFRHEETPEEFNLDHTDVMNHPFLKQIRNQITDGQPVSGCQQCYLDEKNSGKSMRIDSLENFERLAGSPFIIPENPQLGYIDLALSNVCNNKCRMCGPELSTNWYPDAKILGIPINKGIVKNLDPLKNIDVSKLTFIKLIGGEPLLEQEKFIQILNRCNLSNLSIFLATNVTVKPSAELMKLFRRCKHVKIACSIDAYGKLNDFLRKGSVWEEVDKNLRWYSNNFEMVMVHSVVSIYNINQIEYLLEHVKDKYPNTHFQFVMVDGPDWMRPCNLPVEIKDKFMKRINESSHQEIIEFRGIVYDHLVRPGNFAKFKVMDDKLNDIRNEHWKDANPELYDMLKEFYE